MSEFIPVTASTPLAEVEQRCMATAIFPSAIAQTYALKGALGEIGEVCNQDKKIDRDDDGLMTEARARAMSKELGDVFWYFMVLGNAFGARIAEGLQLGQIEARVPNSGIMVSVTGGPAPAVELAAYTTHFPLMKNHGLLLCFFRGLCDFYAGKAKEARLAAGVVELFDFVAVVNGVLRKLHDRQARGTLEGSGDNR